MPTRTKKQILKSREFFNAGFPLYIQEVQQQAIHSHAHEFFEMVYIRRGRGAHVIGREHYPIRAGDLFIIHPGEAHRYALDEESTLLIVNVLWQPKLVRQLLRAGENSLASQSLPYITPLLKPRQKFSHRLHLSGSAAFRVEVLLDEMRRETEAARGATPAPGCQALLRHLFCSLLILLSRVQTGQSEARSTPGRQAHVSSSRAAGQEAVARAITFLESHWNKPIRVEEIASHVALSSSRFSHLFKAQTGRSPIAYQHELKMEHAGQLLLKSTLPIHEVAHRCGFEETRFFHRVFRRHFDCSPAQYRQRPSAP
jgi:AraC-like DNA-binding protein/mannose-6-phosphate isomerase-like protein (cupin superfamily)